MVRGLVSQIDPKKELKFWTTCTRYPCFPKRFDLSQIITPIIDNRHLIVQNSFRLSPIFSINITKKPIVSFDRVYQRTSKALGVSYTSVHRIMNGKRPCKSNRPKERTNITKIYERNAYQVRLKYTWLRERFYR
jgi:hypothetical protein